MADSYEVLMELEKGELIEIPVDKTINFINAMQPEIGIIPLTLTVVLLVLAIFIKTRH